MFRRPPKFIATPDDPFGNDKLGREDEVRRLAHLMKGTHTPLVMTVSAPWGSGKSSFIKMWQAFLESDEGGCHPCIRFDAWKHDFNQDPLLSLMGEIGEFVSKQIENKSKRRRAKTIFNKCAAKLPGLLEGTSSLLSAATFGLSFLAPPVAAATQVAATGTKATAEFAKGVQDYTSKGHATLKKQLDAFRTELEKFVSIVTEGDEGKPFYFFVDELDRCEPLYAIRLLESVKHFYDVPNIIFVLAVDKERLAGMVRRRYGGTYDETGYLKRFVDIDYRLPEVEVSKLVHYYACDVLDLASTTAIDEAPQGVEGFISHTTNMAKDFKLSARDLEKSLLKLYPILCEIKGLSLPADITVRHVADLFECGSAHFKTSSPSIAWCNSCFYLPFLSLSLLIDKYNIDIEKLPSSLSASVLNAADTIIGSQYISILSEFLGGIGGGSVRLRTPGSKAKEIEAAELFIMLITRAGHGQRYLQHIYDTITSYKNITFLVEESYTPEQPA